MIGHETLDESWQPIRDGSVATTVGRTISGTQIYRILLVLLAWKTYVVRGGCYRDRGAAAPRAVNVPFHRMMQRWNFAASSSVRFGPSRHPSQGHKGSMKHGQRPRKWGDMSLGMDLANHDSTSKLLHEGSSTDLLAFGVQAVGSSSHYDLNSGVLRRKSKVCFMEELGITLTGWQNHRYLQRL